MGFMYKEIIFRKRLPVALTFFFAIIFILYMIKMTEIFKLVPANMGRTLDIISLAIVISFGYYELQKCRIKYKYSIIADQLIIHKIKGTEQKLLEDIKIKNIQYIGPSNKVYGVGKHCKTKKYICSILNFNKNCCVYDDGTKSLKIYFEPSVELIEKVKCIKQKNEIGYQTNNNILNSIHNKKMLGC